MHPKLRALIHNIINPAPPPECRADSAAPAATPALPSTCFTCRHWLMWGKEQQHQPKAINGSCRRRSPSLFLIDGQTRTKWPATYAKDGCGDHRPATRPPGLNTEN